MVRNAGERELFCKAGNGAVMDDLRVSQPSSWPSWSAKNIRQARPVRSLLDDRLVLLRDLPSGRLGLEPDGC